MELCAYTKTDLCLLLDGGAVNRKTNKQMPGELGVRGVCLCLGAGGGGGGAASQAMMNFYDPRVARCFSAPSSICWQERKGKCELSLPYITCVIHDVG